MIVFICIICLIIFCILILCFSNIEIDVEDVIIEDHDSIKKILEILLKDKAYKSKFEILNYIKFKVKIRILFLNIIQLFSIRINNYKMKEILIKQYDKEMKKTRKEIERDKVKAKKISKILLPSILLKQSDFNMQLGTEDAAFTAIASSIANIAISIALPYVTDINKIQNINYEVKPIYLNKNVFFLQFSGILSLKLVHIMKVICQKEEKVRNE